MTHGRLSPLPFLPLLASAALLTPAPGVADAGADPPTVTNLTLPLDDALRLTLQDNVSLKQARADAASATARGSQAKTKESLSTTTYATFGDSSNILTTSPGVSPQNIFSVAPRGLADQDLMLMVPLFTGGRLGSAAASAREEGEAAVLSVQAACLTVTEAVTEGYANVALQQALVDVAQARLSAEDEQVRVTQEKVQTGRSAPVDLLREQAELASAQNLVEAAQSGVSAAKGESAPQVYGVAMGDATAGRDIGHAGYTVGLTASLPLYDGGQRRADVDGAGARLERARADAEQARQTVEQEVATAWLNLQTTTAQLAAARSGVTTAQQDFDLANLRYNARKSVTADRLDALAALVRAQGSLNQAKVGLTIAWVRLNSALGIVIQ